MKYLTRVKHEQTFKLADWLIFTVGLSERGRLLKDFANEHVVIQKAKRRK